MRGNFIDLTGKKIGRLIIIKRIYPNDKGRNSNWLCKCDCGTERIIRAHSLRSGKTKSCGCLRNELTIKRIKENPKFHCGGGRKLILGLASFRETIASYKRNAKKRGYIWELTEEQFKELTQKDCFYCGIKPNQIFKNNKGNGNYIYNGLDRIDNLKGYTIDNVVPCCGICNIVKNKLTQQEFLNWVERIYQYQRTGITRQFTKVKTTVLDLDYDNKTTVLDL